MYDLPIMNNDKHDEQSNGLNRRKFVRSIAILGAAPLLSSGAKAQQDKSEANVEFLTGNKRAEQISDAYSSDSIQKLHKELIARGWKPKRNETQSTHVTGVAKQANYRFDEYYVVSIPYSKKGYKQHAVLLWTSEALVNKPIATAHFPNQPQQKSVYDESGAISVTSLIVANGEIESVEESVQDAQNLTKTSSDSAVVAASSCYCEAPIQQCDVPLSCLAPVAASYALDAYACYLCAGAPTLITCGICLLGVGVTSWGGTSCSGNCEQETICLDYDEIPDGLRPCEVCINIYHGAC